MKIDKIWKQKKKRLFLNNVLAVANDVSGRHLTHPSLWSYAQLAGTVKYTDCISTPMSVLYMKLNNLMVRFESWSFGECPFVAIAPMFTLAGSGSTWQGHIYESDRTIWLLFDLK